MLIKKEKAGNPVDGFPVLCLSAAIKSKSTKRIEKGHPTGNRFSE